jgi:hypothetical protein
MPILPIPDWRPDSPDFQNAGSALIHNVLPRTAQSYAPWPSTAVVSGAIGNRCQGALGMKDNAANVRLFLGDSTKLYRLAPDSADAVPADVSGATYTTGGLERWSMALYGLRIIATNYTDPPQSYVEGTDSAFSDMIATGTTSLKARYVAVIKDFVFFGNTTDGTDGAQPQRVWWSAIDDPTNFPTPGTSTAAAKQSDFQDLLGDFGWVQAIVGNLGTANGAIFQERAVVRVNYVGAPAIFQFDVAEGVRGTPAPGSVVQVGALAYYLGEDGFYAFNGSQSVPIGFQKIDKTFFDDLDQSYFHRISATVDPINKIVYWAYPGAGHTDGNPNRILAYHWALDRWTITAANDIQLELITRSMSFGYTLEQLDAVMPSIDADNLPSLDSRVWTGGRILLSGIDTSHRLVNFTGPNLAVTVETSEVQVNPKGRALVKRARPLVDGGTPSIAIGTRNRLTDSVTYTSPVAMDDNGDCPVLAEGRYFRARITLPAGSDFTHLQGIEVPEDEISMGGAR